MDADELARRLEMGTATTEDLLAAAEMLERAYEIAQRSSSYSHPYLGEDDVAELLRTLEPQGDR